MQHPTLAGPVQDPTSPPLHLPVILFPLTDRLRAIATSSDAGKPLVAVRRGSMRFMWVAGNAVHFPLRALLRMH